ncbi:MAG: O-methyltransferase [Bacteroidales bacterium]
MNRSMDLITKETEAYAGNISGEESDVLASLNRETHARMIRPRMLSGHLQGRLLEMISRMVRPERILEIGTYTGYSAICLAQGLTASGLLHTIDHNPELKDFTREYIQRAGLEKKVILHTGEALEVIPTLEEMFDLVFIDADKVNYIRYFDLAYEKLRPGGVILADNVLWSGKVIGLETEADPDTMGIARFNQYVKNHPGIRNLLLPFRDGLMISMKIQ